MATLIHTKMLQKRDLIGLVETTERGIREHIKGIGDFTDVKI